MASAYEKLKTKLAQLVSLENIQALVEWDQQTQMSEGSGASRARHLEALSGLTHEIAVSDELGKLIEAAEVENAGAAYDSDEASMIRVAKRNYERARKLPTDLVSEMSRATSVGFEEWVKARANNDWKAFVPALKKIVELKQQEIECRGYKDHPYDALLDTYELGLTAAAVEGMFSELRKDLVPLVKAIGAKVDAVDDSCLHQPFDETDQRAFSELVITRMGYDFKRGRQDRAVHPFCTSFSQDDVRITTRFDPNWLNPAMFGTFHEAGHAMYEQGSAPALEGTVLNGGTSLGVHESQSRLWENVVGRSRQFWTYWYPRLQGVFIEQFKDVSLDAFYRAVNKVHPSFIRVEADEATYNLHIMVRFEIERDLFGGKLAVEDIPQIWNDKFNDYLGVVPPTDALGCLQDIHWSAGLLGYFPTYSMGNLLSVQLYDTALKQYPTIPDEIAVGEFGSLLRWMRENIHQYGQKYEPQELVKRATGEPMQSRSYMAYLKQKYGEIYNV
ncbi:MAG: carboxypeptidase M32 [Anaerolineae bacterium]|nr:carboxypeptidase M32 [Anaerolineae bacterium]